MKRRAAVDHACQRCRQKRTKCDGKLPCNTCRLAAEQCEYKENKFASKDQLRAEIQQLRRAVDKKERRPSTSEPTEGSSTNVDGADSPFTHASSSTKASSANPEPKSHISEPFDELLSWRSCRPQSAPSPAAREPPVLTPLPFSIWTANSTADSWTKMGWSSAHIHNLFDITATWDYLPFAFLEKSIFLKHYDANSTRLCSTSLVHAILALSILILNGNEEDSHDVTESGIGSRRLLQVAKDLTFLEDKHQLALPDIQALGFMSLYQLRCGRESEAGFLAETMLTQVSDLYDQLPSTQIDHEENDYTRSLPTTYCGAIALIRMLSLATGKYFNLPMETFETTLPLQSLDARSVMQHLFQLIEWVYRLDLPNQTSLADALVAVRAFYTQSLDWYQNFFPILKQDSNITPLVVFTHMYYHFSLLCAFRPLITQRLNANVELEVINICSQAAQSILSLAQSYDDLFTLQRVPTLMPYIILATALFGLAMEESDFRIPSMYRYVVTEQVPAMTQVQTGQQEFGPNPTSDKPKQFTTVSFVYHARLKLSKMGTGHAMAKVAASKIA